MRRTAQAGEKMEADWLCVHLYVFGILNSLKVISVSEKRPCLTLFSAEAD